MMSASPASVIPRAAVLSLVAAALAVSPTPLDAQVREASIVGRVTEKGSGAAVQGAEVVLKGTPHRAVTDDSGIYQIEGVPSGHHTLGVHYLGMESEQFPVEISARETLNVSFSLETQVLPVAELVVTVDQSVPVSKLTGFYRRSRQGPGYFMTRSDIEGMSAARATDLLRRVPGLDVGQRNRAGITPVTMGRRNGCVPRFYVDGAYAAYFDMDNLQTRDIAGIEVYRGNSEVPIRFKHGDRCGVIVVWTRDPSNAQSFR